MNHIGGYIMIFLGCLAFTVNGIASDSSTEPVRTVLDNGMVVIVKENHAASVVSLHAYVRAGSIYEREYLGRGISHNLEHLMSNGTQKRTKEQINQIVEEIGNVSNAYTTKDHTSYYITTASSYFDTALDVLSDYIQNASIPQAEVDSERGVILNEINMGKDDPDRRLYDLFSSSIFRDNPVGVTTIGYRELFEKTTRDDIVNYYKRMYVPNNTVFVVVGDINASDTLGKIKESFRNFQRGPFPDLSLPPLQGQVSKRYVEEGMDVQVAYMMMGFPTVTISHKDLYPLDVLAFIMGEGRSSRFYKKIKDEKQLVYAIGSSSNTPAYDPGGYFGVSAVLDPENLNEAQKAIFDELFKLKTDFVSDEELEKAKRLKESEYIFSQQTVEDQAQTLGGDELSTGDMNFSQRYLEGIKSVTKEDIKRVANEYFQDDKLTVAVIKPASAEKEKPAEAEKVTEGSVKKIIINKITDPLGSQVEGITLLVKENHTVPIISMRAMFLGGVRFENEKDNGVSNFMSGMLIKGTKTRTAQQIAEEMESIGGAISPISGNNSFGVSVSVLKRDLDKGLDILSDVIMNSSFDPKEMEKKRKEILAGIKQQDDDPFSLAAKLCRQTLFKTNPYRFPMIGSAETISNMKQEDLIDFHKKYCVPNNMVIAIFGDIDANEVTAKVEKAFDKFPYGKFTPPQIPAEEPLTSIRNAEMQKEIQQAVICMGFPSITVYDNDRYAIEVLDAILSGVSLPGGRLHERLRANQLVYVVHAYNMAGLDPGMFIIYAGTTPDKLDTVMGIIKEEIEGVQKNLISDEELDRGKKMCISIKQIGLQTNSDQAFTMGLDELYKLGYDNIMHYEEQINAITKEDVKRVAEKYLTLDKYAIAIVKPKG
jgi:zinc protease